MDWMSEMRAGNLCDSRALALPKCDLEVAEVSDLADMPGLRVFLKC